MNEDYFSVPKRSEFTYRCSYCGMECVSKTGLPSGLPPTKTGDYGSNGTPTPSAYYPLLYETETISFTAATATEPAKIHDGALMFGEKRFIGGMKIKVVTDSGTNDGTYTIAERGLTQGTLSLSSSDTLTTEDAATAGTVSIYQSIYEPSVTTGCGFCGSLNSLKK